MGIDQVAAGWLAESLCCVGVLLARRKVIKSYLLYLRWDAGIIRVGTFRERAYIHKCIHMYPIVGIARSVSMG